MLRWWFSSKIFKRSCISTSCGPQKAQWWRMGFRWVPNSGPPKDPTYQPKLLGRSNLPTPSCKGLWLGGQSLQAATGGCLHSLLLTIGKNTPPWHVPGERAVLLCTTKCYSSTTYIGCGQTWWTVPHLCNFRSQLVNSQTVSGKGTPLNVAQFFQRRLNSYSDSVVLNVVNLLHSPFNGLTGLPSRSRLATCSSSWGIPCDLHPACHGSPNKTWPRRNVHSLMGCDAWEKATTSPWFPEQVVFPWKLLWEGEKVDY